MSKTNYVKKIIDDYCVLDTETTGLSAYYDEIIEIAILKVRNNQVVDRYEQLIQPKYEVDSFITSLTGITNEMLVGMPSIVDVKEKVLSFLGDDIIVGHNTSFDLRFLKEGFEQEINNEYIDTVQFSRKVYPELEHHGLSDMVEHLGLSPNTHRSMTDCTATKELYDAIKSTMAEKSLRIEDLWVQSGSRGGTKLDINAIVPTVFEIDEESIFFGKHVVFTGTLQRMVRKDAMQIIVNLGGILDKSVTNNTNYLILGNNDYNPMLKGAKSSKQKKAEKMILDGKDISIIDELTFYDIILD